MFVADDDDSGQIVRLLDQTLSSIDGVSVGEATEALDRLSTELPHFPYHLLSIASGKLFLWSSISTRLPSHFFLLQRMGFWFPRIDGAIRVTLVDFTVVAISRNLSSYELVLGLSEYNRTQVQGFYFRIGKSISSWILRFDSNKLNFLMKSVWFSNVC